MYDMKLSLKTFLLLGIILQGCSVEVVKQPTYPSARYEAWKTSILTQCVDKAHEITIIVWTENPWLDVESLQEIEKGFQDKCVVQNNLAI